MKKAAVIKIGNHFLKSSKTFSKKITLIFSLFITCGFFTNAQTADTPDNNYSLPPEYFSLKADKDKMLFLVKAIGDSLDEGQLKHILDWSVLGLQMAEKNNIDTLKGIFLFDIGKAYAYEYSKYDSAIFYYKQVIPYFPDKMRKYNVFSVREIMDRYADLGNKDSSFVYLDKLKALIDTMPDLSPKRISLSQNIATVYQNFGMYKTAIRYFQVAINGQRQIKNFRGLGLALANLGELYSEMEDNEKAIFYSKEALQYLASVNMPYMQTAGNIADYYINTKQYDSALLYLKKSNEVVEKISDFETKLANRNILSKIYIAQKKYVQAKDILDSNIETLSKTDNIWNLCKAFLNYASLDTALHQFDNAIKHLDKGLAISKKNGFQLLTVSALQNLAAIYSKTGDYKSALEYQMEFMNLKDSIASTKSKADLNDLEISYKTVQKEQQIEILKKENDIATIKLQNNKRSVFFYLAGFLMILGITGIIFFQRSKRNKIQTQKVKAELETQVLRCQMNPHFIFNSLNSIENFIMQNDKRQASDYLNKFSRLVRSILESSRNEVVPVAKDMEILKLYVELEQLRFSNKFNYHTHVDPNLLQGDYRVPSLLLQPYVENAIIHGIAHSHDGELQLTISAFLEGEYIKYIIQDNGIGRKLAAKYNEQNKPGHKSIGLDITAERIAHFNKRDHVNGDVQITDLYNENNEPDGTKIEIQLKAI